MRRTCTRVLPIVNVSPSATWRVQLPTLSTTPPITYDLNRVPLRRSARGSRTSRPTVRSAALVRAAGVVWETVQ
jgi:hypothetical protein